MSTEREFRPMRYAGTSLGVVAFLFVFRPFGMTLDSVAEVLVLLGVAPVCFVIMLFVHALPLPRKWRLVVGPACLIFGITAYLAAWSQGAGVFEKGLAVALTAGLVSAVVYLWNRGNIPEQELARRNVGVAAAYTLSGDNDQEVLQLAPDELLFISAAGNYVDVHYRKGGGSARSMLRGSLARLAAQVPGNALVQCHRSHFVNLAAARRIVRSRGRTLIEFDGGARVPVSRGFRKDVVDAISR
jgi:hypothetical protein